jgi:hypothetical protein
VLLLRLSHLKIIVDRVSTVNAVRRLPASTFRSKGAREALSLSPSMLCYSLAKGLESGWLEEVSLQLCWVGHGYFLEQGAA